jgi:hypothetical protein
MDNEQGGANDQAVFGGLIHVLQSSYDLSAQRQEGDGMRERIPGRSNLSSGGLRVEVVFSTRLSWMLDLTTPGIPSSSPMRAGFLVC